MNKKTRIGMSALVILALLVAVSPVSAGAIKTEVTGTYYWLNEYPGEDYREWISDHYVFHTRNLILVLLFVTSDPRTDGYYRAVVNLDWGVSPDWESRFGHNLVTAVMYEDATLTVPKWDCRGSGHWERDGNFRGHTVCHGLGANEGLQWIIYDEPASGNDLGVIIDPAN